MVMWKNINIYVNVFTSQSLFLNSYSKLQNISKTSVKLEEEKLKFYITSWSFCLCNSLSEVAQSCPTLCDPMDCSLPDSSNHGIFQARVLEWGAISFSRGSSWSRDWTQVSHIAGRCFTIWATREVCFLRNLDLVGHIVSESGDSKY